MLKKISKLNGAQELNKAEQQAITGGMLTPCSSNADCQAAVDFQCESVCVVNFGICLFRDPC